MARAEVDCEAVSLRGKLEEGLARADGVKAELLKVKSKLSARVDELMSNLRSTEERHVATVECAVKAETQARKAISNFLHSEQISQLQNAERAIDAREANAKLEWTYPRQIDWSTIFGQASAPGGDAWRATERAGEEAPGSSPAALARKPDQGAIVEGEAL